MPYSSAMVCNINMLHKMFTKKEVALMLLALNGKLYTTGQLCDFAEYYTKEKDEDNMDGDSKSTGAYLVKWIELNKEEKS